MKTENETYQALVNNIQYKKYEVNPDIDVLEVGDYVMSETIIGYQRKTGQPVTAGLHGQVLAIYFYQINNPVMVLAVS